MSDPQSPADKSAGQDKVSDETSKPGASVEGSPAADTSQKAASKSSAKSTAKSIGKSAGKSSAKSAPKAKSSAKAKSAAKKAAPKGSGKSADKEAAGSKVTASKAPEKTSSTPADKVSEPKKADVPPSTPPENTSGAVPTTGSAAPSLSGHAVIIAVAAVFGAVLAIVFQLVFGATSGDGVAQSQLAELQAQVERNALAAGDPEAVGRLQVRLDGMEEDLRALNAGVARVGDLTALETSLGEARERLAVLETGGARAPRNSRASNGDVAALEGQIATLSASTQAQLVQLTGTVDALEGNLLARLESFVGAQTFAALASRVATLEDDELAREMYKAATALGLAQLARTAQGSAPFAVELEAIAALRPRDLTIAELRPLAQTGIATDAMLASEFPFVARQVMYAHRASLDQGVVCPGLAAHNTVYQLPPHRRY